MSHSTRASAPAVNVPGKKYLRLARRLAFGGEFGRWLAWRRQRGPLQLRARTLTATIPEPSFPEYCVATLFREQPIVHEFLQHIPPGGVFWDVGACMGIWSAFAGQLADSTVAFEPDTRITPYLRKNLTANDINAQIVTCGLSDSRREHRMRLNDRWGRGELVEFTTRRAADLIANGSPRPDAVKIDVEGAEGRVLDGMGEYLADVSALLIEVHPDALMGGWKEWQLHDRLTETHSVEKVYEFDRRYYVQALKE